MKLAEILGYFAGHGVTRSKVAGGQRATPPRLGRHITRWSGQRHPAVCSPCVLKLRPPTICPRRPTELILIEATNAGSRG